MIRFVLFICLFCEMAYSQISPNDTCFLLGLLQYHSGKMKIDSHSKEKYLISYMSPTSNYFAKKRIKEIKLLNSFTFESNKLYSKDFAPYFNSFFRFKKPKEGYYEENDIDYPVSFGVFKTRKVKNKEQRIEYLKAAFVIDGKVMGNKYMYDFANSMKWKVVKCYLKKVGCKKVDILQIDGIPHSTTISFIPSARFKIELDRLLQILKSIPQSP